MYLSLKRKSAILFPPTRESTWHRAWHALSAQKTAAANEYIYVSPYSTFLETTVDSQSLLFLPCDSGAICVLPLHSVNTVLAEMTSDLGPETRGGDPAALTLLDLFKAANRADLTIHGLDKC